MRYVYAIGFLIALLFVIGAGCSKGSVCSEGQTMIEDTCCFDKDVNGACDSETPTETVTGTPTETTEETAVAEEVVPKTGYVWSDAMVSVTGYLCINESIAINFKNNLPNAISIEKVKLGSSYAKGLPTFIKSKEVKDIEIPNSLLIKGSAIDQSLFVEYKDWVKKETKYIGPAKLEGVC